MRNKGNATAQANLAWRYQHGLGVEKDYKQAHAWYLKSAEQGHAGARYNLGIYVFQRDWDT